MYVYVYGPQKGWSQDIVLCSTTRLQLSNRRIEVQFLVGTKYFSPRNQTGSVPTHPRIQGTEKLFRGIRRPGRQASHFRLYRAIYVFTGDRIQTAFPHRVELPRRIEVALAHCSTCAWSMLCKHCCGNGVCCGITLFAYNKLPWYNRPAILP
jgi:hypothetical protein